MDAISGVNSTVQNNWTKWDGATPQTPVLMSLSHSCEFKDILVYTVRPCLQNEQGKKTKKSIHQIWNDNFTTIIGE